jgi:hypothetical protein
VALARRRAEEALVCGIRPAKLGDELRSDLVGVRSDRRAEHGDHSLATRPLALHDLERRFENTDQRPAPARVAGADDVGLGIGEEHRAAIRRGDAEREAGPRRHHAVGSGTRLARPGLLDHDRVRRVDLVHADERLGRQAQLHHHAPAVLGDARRVVGRAEAAVERGVDALRDPALTGEEGVAHAGVRAELWRFDEHRG